MGFSHVVTLKSPSCVFVHLFTVSFPRPLSSSSSFTSAFLFLFLFSDLDTMRRARTLVVTVDESVERECEHVCAQQEKSRTQSGVWPYMCIPEILQLRATAQEVNDATKYGPYCELFFFFMTLEPEPHVSTEAFLRWPAQEIYLASQSDTKRSDETVTARRVSEPFFFLRVSPSWKHSFPLRMTTRAGCTRSGCLVQIERPLTAREQALRVPHAGSARTGDFLSDLEMH